MTNKQKMADVLQEPMELEFNNNTSLSSYVLCLAAGNTYDLILQTGITAHPAVAPYPKKNPPYITPIKKGGILEFLYKVTRIIECYPDDIRFYKDNLNTTEYERLTTYHEIRKQTFGYSKKNEKYKFYILENPKAIKQPYIRKGIQISVFINLSDIPLENTFPIDKLDKELNSLNLQGKEKLAYVKVRINQGIFRERLLQHYKKCRLCNVKNTELLRASHIKPWVNSSANEKLDIENGLLLCPNHDALFDKGFISFTDDGKIIISDLLKSVDRIYMNVNPNMQIQLTKKNKVYMNFHRKYIFKKN